VIDVDHQQLRREVGRQLRGWRWTAIYVCVFLTLIFLALIFGWHIKVGGH
jgi:hypothetical protein